MSYSWQRRNVCVRDRRAYTTMYSSNKNKWAQSLEQRERESQKLLFFLVQKKLREKERGRGRESKNEKRSVCVCAFCAYFGVHSEAVDTATSVCASTWALCLFPNMCVQWKVNGSPVYTFLKNQPWCHHEPILNPPLSKSITPALPPSASFSVPPLPPSRSIPASRILHWAPILLLSSFSSFRILQHFPSPVHVSFLSPSSLTESLSLFFFFFLASVV